MRALAPTITKKSPGTMSLAAGAKRKYSSNEQFIDSFDLLQA
jgi:hypothetical protein